MKCLSRVSNTMSTRLILPVLRNLAWTHTVSLPRSASSESVTPMPAPTLCFAWGETTANVSKENTRTKLNKCAKSATPVAQLAPNQTSVNRAKKDLVKLEVYATGVTRTNSYKKANARVVMETASNVGGENSA